MKLEQTIAIVTGSSSGVGAATAKQIAAAGGKVVVNYVSKDQAAELVAEECRALGGEAVVCKGDVSDDAACQQLVQTATEHFGGLNCLINNAGTTKFNAHEHLAGLTDDDFYRIYGVNVVGPYQMVRAAESALRTAKESVVVNVASIAGVRGVGSSIAYAASKGALITMTQSLARVMGPEVRVNAVCPGFIEGDWLAEGMGQEVYDRSLASLRERTPLQTVCTPETVADSIVGFITAHGVVTGQLLVLDGGHLLL